MNERRSEEERGISAYRLRRLLVFPRFPSCIACSVGRGAIRAVARIVSEHTHERRKGTNGIRVNDYLFHSMRTPRNEKVQSVLEVVIKICKPRP